MDMLLNPQQKLGILQVFTHYLMNDWMNKSEEKRVVRIKQI